MKDLREIEAKLKEMQKLGDYIESDVTRFQERLTQIESLRDSDGVFLRSQEIGCTAIPAGQAELSFLLHNCRRMAHHLMESHEVDPSLQPAFWELFCLQKELHDLRANKEDENRITTAFAVKKKLDQLSSKTGLPTETPAQAEPQKQGLASVHRLMGQCQGLLNEIFASAGEEKNTEGQQQQQQQQKKHQQFDQTPTTGEALQVGR